MFHSSLGGGLGLEVVVVVLVVVLVVEVLEPHDTVNVTYMFMLVGVTVVLDGLMVQPGTVLAVNWALVPGG
jgi:hypothetical protein